MPIKKRTKDLTKTRVFINEKGTLIVRTPAVCTKWDQSFRERVVRDYYAPRTLVNQHEYIERYVNTGLVDRVYRVQGNNLVVKHPFELLGPSKVVILRTDIHNLTTDTKLFLAHEDPAMRMLMVYSFLTGEKIGGVPDLRIAKISEDWSVAGLIENG